MGTYTAKKATLTVDESLTEQKQASETLLNNDVRRQEVVENVSTGIAVADLTGRFVAANAAYQKILGYTFGRKAADLVERPHSDDR